MCMLFIVVDMGQPQRVMNMFLHPTPNSVMFWDATVLLCGYLILNAVIGWTTLEARTPYDVQPPKWIKYSWYMCPSFGRFPFIPSPAFLYAGSARSPLLAHRHHGRPLPGLGLLFRTWHPAACCFCFMLKRLTGFDPGKAVVTSAVA